MATKYVSGSSGLYPAGDGSDGSTWAKAYTTIQAGINSLSGTTDDEVVLDPQEVYQLTTNLQLSSCTKTGGSITIRSENNSFADGCAIQGNTSGGNWYLLRVNKASVSHSIKGIRFQNQLRTDGLPIILIDQNCGTADCVWENVDFSGITYNYNGANSMAGLLRVGNISAAMPLKFNNISASNITVTYAGSGIGREGSFFSTQNNYPDVTFDGIVIDGLTVTSDNNYQDNGVIFCRGAVTYSGACSFNNISFNSAGKPSHGVVKIEPVGDTSKKCTVTADALMTFTNITFTGAGSAAHFYGLINYVGDIDFYGSLSIHDNIINQGTGAAFGLVAGLVGNKVGAECKFFDNGNVREIYNNSAVTSALGCTSVNGDKKMSADKIRIHDNLKFTSGIHHASSGNGSYRKAMVANNTGATVGFGSTAHVENLSTASAITVDFSGLLGVGNLGVQGNASGIYISANGTGGTSGPNVTVNLSSAILWNSGLASDEIEVVSVSSGTHAVTVDHSVIKGGGAATSGVDTFTNNISDDPILTTDYHLQPTSPCIGAGTPIAGITTDIEGNQLYPPYNIGPYGAAAGALEASPTTYPGSAKLNITRISGTSTTLSDTDTYTLPDSHTFRTSIGWTWGVDHWAYTDAGVPKEVTGAVIKENGDGLRWYVGTKGLALYPSDQTANDAKIKKYLKVPA